MRFFGKALVTLAGLFSLTVCNASAGTLREYGIRVGVGISNVGIPGFNTGYGFQAGGAAELFDFHGLSTILEVNYSEVGVEYGSGTNDARIGYVSVPVLIKLRGSASRVCPHLTIGTQVDRKVSETFETGGPYANAPALLASNSEPWVWRASVGLGATVRTSGLSIPLDVRATFDISNSFAEPVAKRYGDGEVSMISVTVGVRR